MKKIQILEFNYNIFSKLYKELKKKLIPLLIMKNLS